MAARLRAPELGWQAALLAAAVGFGWMAGLRPALAVAAAIALGFVLIVMADLTAGLLVFAAVSFVDVLPGTPAFSFTKVIGLVLALSWLATLAWGRGRRREFFSVHPVALYLLALFLTWTSLSVLWSTDQNAAVTAASRYGLNFLLFPIVYTAVRERRHLRWLVWTFVAGALLSAAYGVAFPQPTEEGRLAGAIGEANELASVLLAATVLSIGLAIAARRASLARAAALAAAAICAAGVVISLSRAALVAACLVVVASVFVAGRWRGRAAVAALVIALAGVTYFASFTTPQARERVTRFEGGTGRIDLWTLGWRMVEQRPLLGVGAGNFETSTPRYLVRPGVIVRDDFVLDHPKQTHNIYLQVLSELGIPGLALFGSIVVFCLACSLRAARRARAAGDLELEPLAWAVFVATIGVLATDFFQSEQFSKQLWLLLALGPALLALPAATGAGAPAPRHARLRA
jgi:O-antigen ligase